MQIEKEEGLTRDLNKNIVNASINTFITENNIYLTENKHNNYKQTAQITNENI